MSSILMTFLKIYSSKNYEKDLTQFLIVPLCFYSKVPIKDKTNSNEQRIQFFVTLLMESDSKNLSLQYEVQWRLAYRDLLLLKML